MQVILLSLYPTAPLVRVRLGLLEGRLDRAQPLFGALWSLLDGT